MRNCVAGFGLVLAAAISLTQAAAGTVQILEEKTQDLLLLAIQGFEQSIAGHFYRVMSAPIRPVALPWPRDDTTA